MYDAKPMVEYAGRTGLLLVMGTLLWWGDAVHRDGASDGNRFDWLGAVTEVWWTYEHMMRHAMFPKLSALKKISTASSGSKKSGSSSKRTTVAPRSSASARRATAAPTSSASTSNTTSETQVRVGPPTRKTRSTAHAEGAPQSTTRSTRSGGGKEAAAKRVRVEDETEGVRPRSKVRELECPVNWVANTLLLLRSVRGRPHKAERASITPCCTVRSPCIQLLQLLVLCIFQRKGN